MPEILQLPRRMVPMLPSVWSDTTCEYSVGLHKLVEEKFQAIAHHWFQPVPSMPDYFFFSPEALQRSSRVSFFLLLWGSEFLYVFLCAFLHWRGSVCDRF